MKQILTKQWLNKNKITITEVGENGTTDTYFVSHKFRQDFEPSCCDSCSDGEMCDSQVSVDRIPEETSAEYMDRVATINGRK